MTNTTTTAYLPTTTTDYLPTTTSVKSTTTTATATSSTASLSSTSTTSTMSPPGGITNSTYSVTTATADPATTDDATSEPYSSEPYTGSPSSTGPTASVTTTKVATTTSKPNTTKSVTNAAAKSTKLTSILMTSSTPKGTCIPPTVEHGTPSNGSFSPGNLVTYVCSAGFSLASQAPLLCENDLKWNGSAPQCVAASTTGGPGPRNWAQGGNGGGGNNVYFGDSVPLWLAIVLGVTFGIICLLMLTCLLMYCLRLCGCVKGSLFGDVAAGGSTVAAPAHGGTHVSTRGPKVNQGTSISFIELGPFDDYQTVTTRGRPLGDTRHNFTRNQKNAKKGVRPGNRFEEYSNSYDDTPRRPSPRIKAKQPTNKWMPHSQQKRNINTSTN